jgi:quercetin dioxygenase-like cupin family protein
MFLKRFEDAKPYEAANHRDCVGLRLQGWEEGSSKSHWIGLSHFLPGGGAGPDSTPFEKIYVVLEGELTITIDGKTTVLKKYDSCTIPPNEVREIVNASNHMCTLLVSIPYPPGHGA